MNAQLVALFAAISAANARVAGMSAANAQRAVCGESPAYGEDHFASEAQHLEMLSVEARNAV